MSSCDLKQSSRLGRAFDLLLDGELLEVVYDGGGNGFEEIRVNGRVAIRKMGILWFVPRFDFLLDDHILTFEVKVGARFSVRASRLSIDFAPVFTEGSWPTAGPSPVSRPEPRGSNRDRGFRILRPLKSSEIRFPTVTFRLTSQEWRLLEQVEQHRLSWRRQRWTFLVLGLTAIVWSSVELFALMRRNVELKRKPREEVSIQEVAENLRDAHYANLLFLMGWGGTMFTVAFWRGRREEALLLSIRSRLEAGSDQGARVA